MPDTHGVLPSELSSFHAAVYRLRYRSPLVVRPASVSLQPLTPPNYFHIRRRSNNSAGSFKVRVHSPPSGFCTARKSATRLGGLDQAEHTALLGLLPLQGLLPHSKQHNLHHASPHAVFKKNASIVFVPLQGLNSKQDWLVFFKTAYPRWVSHLMVITPVRFNNSLGVTSSEFGVRHRPLVNPS